MAEIEEIGGNFNPNTQPAGFYSTKCQESAHLRIQEKKQVLGQWSSVRNVWMLNFMKSLVHKNNGLIKYFHDAERHGRALHAVWGCPREKIGK